MAVIFLLAFLATSLLAAPLVLLAKSWAARNDDATEGGPVVEDDLPEEMPVTDTSPPMLGSGRESISIDPS